MRSSHKIEPRLKPHYVGIDPRVKSLIREYVNLARQHGIRFTRPITVGFTDINTGIGDGNKVIGICFYGKNFREIDIDNRAWNMYPADIKEELVRHELTHCLCGRGHDYGNGEQYPSVEVEEIIDLFRKWPFYVQRPGRYSDGCPLSIMFPYVLSQKCIQSHRRQYYKEMFNRCSPAVGS